jgi:hypothetical protein
MHPQVKALQAGDPPLMAVETNKKALLGEVNNPGQARRPTGDPVRVRGHACARPELGTVAPSGVDAHTQQRGWVHVGTDHATAACAVASLRRWWNTMGQQVYPHAQRWLLTADSGGSHGSRTRRWTTAWQKVAKATALEISVCQLPPGPSTWHKSAPRLLSSIRQNWSGTPLVSHEVRVHLIASTTTRTGLPVSGERDTNKSPQGLSITDKELKQGHMIRDPCHGAWNDTITPHPS